MTDDMIIECPAPECTFEGNKHALRGHWGGTTDDKHSGSITALLQERESDTEATESDESPSEGNPAMGGPTADTPDNTGQPQQTAGTELPCGCESVDMSDVEPPVIIKCDVCGRQYPYE